MPTGNDPVTTLLGAYTASGAAEKSDVAELLRLAGAVPHLWSQELPLHLTASALVVHVPTGSMLLRWHARQQSWLQVGGHGDPGESDPLDVALREGREETGLTDLVPWPDAGLVHVVMCAVPARGSSPAHVHGDLRFVLATASPDAARPERPDAPLRWLNVDEAKVLASEDNLLETIGRVDALLRRHRTGTGWLPTSDQERGGRR